ncbi:MAG: hypothetical protein H6782_01955 [Candidatus Nomurabacteria bacterium]|nr:MAG: hypothetical protein H6782_01955 [Candidatus Nomurabacteria bacterium]
MAQFDSNSIGATELAIELQPEFPRPGEEVIATLNDYRGGTYGSSITWVLDGKEIPDAKNQRQTIITAGPSGKVQTIEIVLSKPDGGREVISNTLKPYYLDVIIEPQTRTPDFYLGRSLPSIGSIVNATALVSGVNGFLDTDLIYTWRLGRTVFEGGPLRGRNKISFETPMGKEMILSVEVTKPDGEIIASRAMFVASVEPEIYFYEVSTLFGIKPIPVDENISLIGNSLIIRAEPYNLDSRVFNNPDVSEWQIDRITSNNTGSNPYEVTLKRNDSGSGLSELQFHVRDLKQILQGAKGGTRINY